MEDCFTVLILSASKASVYFLCWENSGTAEEVKLKEKQPANPHLEPIFAFPDTSLSAKTLHFFPWQSTMQGG